VPEKACLLVPRKPGSSSKNPGLRAADGLLGALRIREILDEIRKTGYNHAQAGHSDCGQASVSEMPDKVKFDSLDVSIEMTGVQILTNGLSFRLEDIGSSEWTLFEAN
jgi:hypothetical protein